MMNPLTGIDVKGPTVNPLWQENQEFDLFCYFSSSVRFKSM